MQRHSTSGWRRGVGWASAAATVMPFLWAAGRLAAGIVHARGLISRGHCYARPVPGRVPRMLVVGDSIACGTGVSRTANSLPGLIAARFPLLHVVNRARIGARWGDVGHQLARDASHFELVLIVAGGNDILRRTRLARLGRDINLALGGAGYRGSHVIVVGSPNVGLAPMFAWPLRSLATRRARLVRDAIAERCALHGAQFIDLLAEPSADPIADDPGAYFATDGIHPNDRSHRYALECIDRQTSLASIFGLDRPPYSSSERRPVEDHLA